MYKANKGTAATEISRVEPKAPAVEDVSKEIAEVKAMLAAALENMRLIRVKLVGAPSSDKGAFPDRPPGASHFEEWKNSMRDMRETLSEIINIQDYLKNLL